MLLDHMGVRTKADHCKYQRAAEVLRQQILDGSLKPSERLPSERDLCLQLGVSRITIRLALKLLGDEGLIKRLHGSGTYVSNSFPASPVPPKVSDPRQLSRELVFQEWVPGPLARQFCPDLSTDDDAFHFKRQYSFQGKVLIWDRCFMSAKFADRLRPEDLLNEHFTAHWMRVQKFQIKTFTQTLEDVAASREDARILGVKPGETMTGSIEKFGTESEKVVGVFFNHYHPELAKVNHYYHWLEANRVANIPKPAPE
jgi:GntR family transcriptional regulator